jgi:uncharacterized protein (TIGR00369 family)
MNTCQESSALEQAKRQRRKEALRQSLLLTPFASSLGLQFELFEPEGVCLRLPFDARLTNDGECLHGGVISAALDTAGAAAFWAAYDYSEVVRAATIAMSIQFTSVCRASALGCTARVVRLTKSVAFTEATALDSDGRVVAHGMQTFMISRRAVPAKAGKVSAERAEQKEQLP